MDKTMDYKKQLEEVEQLTADTLKFVKSSNLKNDSVINMPLHTGFGWRESLIVVTAISLGLYLGLYVL